MDTYPKPNQKPVGGRPVTLTTEPGYTVETFRGRPIALETTEEVIVKKIRFRAATFTARDIFDLAAAARTITGLPQVLDEEVGDALPRLKALIEARRASGMDLHRAIRPTAAFKDLLSDGKAYAEACATIDAALVVGG